MSAAGGTVDKPLELIQKTYHLQSTTNPREPSAPSRSSTAKVSNNHPSRKTSVHDVQEATRDDFNKTMAELHEGLARFKSLLESMMSAATVRDEFRKMKNHLITIVIEFNHKLTHDTGRRSMTSLKGQSNSLQSFNAHQLIFYIEYFRNELMKAQYLFSSLTLSASIGTSTLADLVIRPVSTTNLRQSPTDVQTNEDLKEIKKEIADLEEHAYALGQRFYSQIPDWNPTDDGNGRTMPGTTMMTGATSNGKRLGVNGPGTQKMSAASSTTSIERSHFCARLYQKCQIVCCICTPKYL